MQVCAISISQEAIPPMALNFILLANSDVVCLIGLVKLAFWKCHIGDSQNNMAQLALNFPIFNILPC